MPFLKTCVLKIWLRGESNIRLLLAAYPEPGVLTATLQNRKIVRLFSIYEQGLLLQRRAHTALIAPILRLPFLS